MTTIKPPFDKFLMFDVESVGLHGEGFSVGYVIMENGEEIIGNEVGCALHSAYGHEEDREWVRMNVSWKITFADRKSLLRAFAPLIHSNVKMGYAIVTDCGWPVETNFLTSLVESTGVKDNVPYPLYDVSSVLAALGYDPIATYPRKENELPAHNPLNDARQSARVLLEALAGTLEKPE